MSDREFAEIVCRALLSIVAALRRKYNLPNKSGVQIILCDDGETVAGVKGYNG